MRLPHGRSEMFNVLGRDQRELFRVSRGVIQYLAMTSNKTTLVIASLFCLTSSPRELSPYKIVLLYEVTCILFYCLSIERLSSRGPNK